MHWLLWIAEKRVKDRTENRGVMRNKHVTVLTVIITLLFTNPLFSSNDRGNVVKIV